MTSSQSTPPDDEAGSGPLAAPGIDTDDQPGAEALLKRVSEPVVTEVLLGGSVPRSEPSGPRALSGDLYIRLEGQIYGPFQPDAMDEVLQSGKLTGLEVASPDLNRWTPLAYHPRIVRGRIRDFDRAHEMLRERSALPARKQNPLPILPLAAVVRKPDRLGPDGEPEPMSGDDDDTPTDGILDQ